MSSMNLLERVTNRLRRLRRNRIDKMADRLTEQMGRLNEKLAEVVAGLNNQTQLINDRLSELIAGIDNQSRLINDRLKETVAGIDNQSRLTNHLKETVAGIDNQSRLLATKTDKVIAGLDNQSRLLATKADKLVAGLDNQSRLLTEKFDKLILGYMNHSQLFDRKTEEVIRGLNNLSGGGPLPPSEQNGDSKLQPAQPIASHAPLRDDVTVDNECTLVGETIAPSSSLTQNTNDLETFRDVFKGIKPFAGYVPPQFIADFLGQLIDIEFHPMLFTDPTFDAASVGDGYEETVIPKLSDAKTPADAEAWFEAVDWVISAREATDRYVMITLGANYGAQAVGAFRALQTVNPLPYKLVAVDPVPGNVEWTKRHLRNNDIDPDEQWIVPLAISGSTAPLFFPVGGPGLGSNNCYSTNEREAREQYAEEFIASGMSEKALRNMLLHNTTGLMKDLIPGQNFMAEIKLVGSITLHELLGPFSKVDLLESDIQQSEILVFPPFRELLRQKVRRIHIGTHGEDVHLALHHLFADDGWEIVFSYKPNSRHESALGSFEVNDGILTVRNPDL